MKKKFFSKGKTILCCVISSLLILSSVAYVAADRFLIEHVQSTVSDITSSGSGTAAEMTESGSNSSETVSDTTFESDTASIKISKITTGSGSNQMVYFVADITVKDGTQVLSAFAKNSYGTNITQKVSEMAAVHNAVFAINGDYYGFRSDGIIIRNGVIYRNSPVREGLAFYKDGTMKVYNEKDTTADQLLAEGVWNTLSFGPALLSNGNIVSDIDSVEVDTNFGNHSIQGSQPRTGVGIISQNHFVFVVADGRSKNYSAGVTMTGFAQIFQNLGCTTAYNIDGGGSSEMWFNGSVVNYPCNGNGSERATSDILYISK